MIFCRVGGLIIPDCIKVSKIDFKVGTEEMFIYYLSLW